MVALALALALALIASPRIYRIHLNTLVEKILCNSWTVFKANSHYHFVPKYFFLNHFQKPEPSCQQRCQLTVIMPYNGASIHTRIPIKPFHVTHFKSFQFSLFLFFIYLNKLRQELVAPLVDITVLHLTSNNHSIPNPLGLSFLSDLAKFRNSK